MTEFLSKMETKTNQTENSSLKLQSFNPGQSLREKFSYPTSLESIDIGPGGLFV